MKGSSNAAPTDSTEAKILDFESDGATVQPIDMRSTDRFINRELSWLAFNERVLNEAENLNNPLLERLRFLSISANNLNEFFMVRVAGLKGQVGAGVEVRSQEGLSPRRQLELINERCATIMQDQQVTWSHLRDELSENGITVVTRPEELNPVERDWVDEHFNDKLFPVLTPIAIDPAHPFPFIPNLGFAMVLALKRKDEKKALNALVPLPQLMQRFTRIPGSDARFITMETMVEMFAERLFPGFELLEIGQCRVLRDSDIEVEEEAEDLVRLYESALKRRRRGSVIRLTINKDMSRDLQAFITEQMGVSRGNVFKLGGLIGLAETSQLIPDDRPEMSFEPYVARMPERIADFGGDHFEAIRAKDMLVHHPFESFDVVVQFLRQAARDPSVVAIKQTLYRTSEDSPILEALMEAAEAGKSVTALVELKARFDEERNIRWARNLERVGVHVVYGFVHLKTHMKLSLVIRNEGGDLQSYCHFGTGNYHPITARVYTDLSFFTCDQQLCRDAARLFHYTTGTAVPDGMEKVAFSPVNLRTTLLALIEDEIRHVESGRPGTIWIKLNSLVDGDVIDALYRASQAGVNCQLIIRGICCLKPGVPGLSENISVKSVVGRFLEHGRIVCFGAGNPLPSPDAKVFISSADWMPRNLDRRVESFVPIENETVHAQILEEIMMTYFKDEAQSWIMRPDGTYQKATDDKDAFSAHTYFMTNPSLSGRGSALHDKAEARDA
jgi:polyphosphate kinase